MDRTWSGKTEGGTFGQRYLLWYFRHGSIRLLYIVLALVVPFYMLFAHKRYLAIYHYFRKILHRSVLSSFVSTYRNHFLFGQAMFDKMALFAGRTDKYRLELVGNEVFDNQLDNPKGIVMASSHCGHFELAGHILKQNKKNINALAFGDENPDYQQARQKSLDKHNITLIPAKEDMSHILVVNNALQNGEIVISPSDRAYKGSRMAKFNFLGKEADFPTGPFYFASRFNTNLFTVFVMKEGPFHYKGYVYQLPVITDSKNANQNAIDTAKGYVEIYEKIMKKYPLQWYNFFEFWP